VLIVAGQANWVRRTPPPRHVLVVAMAFSVMGQTDLALADPEVDIDACVYYPGQYFATCVRAAPARVPCVRAGKTR
jgi:hypothetical protein